MIAPTDLVSPIFDRPVVVEQSPSLTPSDRMHEWSRAFDQWLAELPSANTRRAYQRAWRDLLHFTSKLPWAIRSDDIRDWMQDLGERPIDKRVAKGLKKKGRREGRFGYAPSTIAQYLAAVSSFFTFATECYLIADREGRECPLHDGVNPARAVRRPKPNPFGKADYLDAQDLYALLRAINRDTLQGLRDFALFAGYILTARRNSEWRTLQWRDLEKRGDKINYVWNGKGRESQRHELPPPIWEAICNYLQAADRLETMAEADYIFTPLTDRAIRLFNVNRFTWDRNRPLAPNTVNKLLKRYAGKAGLDATRLHIHILRHSAAMLREAGGDDLQSISNLLGHSNVNHTMIYLDHMKGVEDRSWRQAATALKLDLLQRPELVTG